MKKLLAILTALVMAASFAVGNVCAVNYDQNILPISDVHTEKIPLYPIAASNTKVVETQFTIPIYALYGYMTQGYYLSLYLPVGMPGTANDSTEVSLIAKGVEYQLKPMPDPLRYSSGDAAPAVYENKINFGYGVHSYNSITDDTTIPPSTVFGDLTSVMVVIRRTVWDTYDISKDAELFAEGGDYALSAYMKHYSESGDELFASTTYGQDWDVTSKQISEEAEGFEFASVGDSASLWHDLKVVETQITIPVYALYGYMTQGYYLSLNLPTGMPDTVYGTTELSLMANGVVYLLKPMPDPLSYSSGDTVPAVYENIINFGKEIHSYNAITDDTTILPSSEFGDYTSLTVVIRRTVWDTYDISKDAELFAEGGDYAFSAFMKICSESDGSEVIGSTSYGQNWNVTSEEYPIATGDTIDLSWDHTLAARNIVDSANAIFQALSAS